MKFKFYFDLLVCGGLAFALRSEAEQVRSHPITGGTEYAILSLTSPRPTVLVTREWPRRLPILISSEEFSNSTQASDRFSHVTLGWPSIQLETSPASGSEVMALEVPGDSLWKVTESWSDLWEQRFSNWVANEVTPDFFSNDLATDCADVIYAARWIFARNNGLPMVNRLGGSGQIFSHLSVKPEWARKRTHENWRKDQKFLAALNYLLSLTYTDSLARDSFAIKINATNLRPGTHWSYIKGETGHNYLVTEVRDGKDGRLPITLSYSTVPRDYRTLAVNEFSDPVQPKEGGFANMRWPEQKPDGSWRLRAAEQMAGYSLEQYSPEFTVNDAFDEAVFNKVAPDRLIDFKRKVKSQLETLLTRVKERVGLVESGYKVCYPDRCPAGSRNYDDYSTPTRDGRILQIIQQAQQTVVDHPDTKWTYNLFVWNHRVGIDGQSFQSFELTLDEIIQIWLQQKYSSDPNHSVEQRWGR